MVYQPSKAAVRTVEELHAFVDRELAAVAEAINEAPALDLREAFREPQRPRDGMLVFADGTEWNPGEGRGLYVRDTTWRRFARHFTFNVMDYGAKLDGATDDTEALVAAAAALRAAGKGTLWFPPGKKCLVSYYPHTGHTANGERTVLLFTEEDLEVEIAGNGTQILFDADERSTYAHFVKGDGSGFASSLRCHGFVYDYLKPSVVQGVVSAIVPGTNIDVDLDTVPTFSDVQRLNFYRNKLFEGAPFKQNHASWNAGGPLTLVSGSTYRIDTSGGTEDLSELVVGDEVTLEHQTTGTDFVHAANFAAVDVRNNIIRHTAGMCVFITGGEYIRLYNNQIIPEVGLRIPYTSVRDGLHVKSSRYVDLINNSIVGTHDDAINVNGRANNVISRDSATQISISNTSDFNPSVGDLLQIVNSDRELQLETRIVSIVDPTASPCVITVADTIPASVDNTHQVIHVTEIANIVYNAISEIAGRGILGAARELNIRSNTVYGVNGKAVLIFNDDNSAAAIKSFTVSHNKAFRCGVRETSFGGEGVFRIYALTTGGSGAPTEVYENGTISDNLIEEANNAGIDVAAVAGLVICNNILISLGMNGQTFSGFSAGVPIALENCDDVLIDGNVLVDSAVIDVEAQDVTNVRWGTNSGMIPSSGTNLLTFESTKGVVSGASRGVFLPETARLLEAFDEVPRPRIARAMDELIDDLIEAGVWDKLDVLYLFGSHTQQAALLNWKQPGLKTATVAGTLTFTQYQGFTGDASTGYINTGLTPSTIGSYAQDDAHAGAWQRTAGATTNEFLVSNSGNSTNWRQIIRPTNGTNFVGRINSANSVSYGANTTETGHFVVNRTGATASEAFLDAVSLGTSAEASADPATQNAEILLLRSQGAFSDDQVFAYHAGVSLTSTEISDLYDALSAYKTAIGA